MWSDCFVNVLLHLNTTSSIVPSLDWLLKKTTFIIRNQQPQIHMQSTFLGNIEWASHEHENRLIEATIIFVLRFSAELASKLSEQVFFESLAWRRQGNQSSWADDIENDEDTISPFNLLSCVSVHLRWVELQSLSVPLFRETFYATETEPKGGISFSDIAWCPLLYCQWSTKDVSSV